MRSRCFVKTLVMFCAAVLMSSSAWAQAKSWTVPRTQWGDPDIQGSWPANDMQGTPYERPESFGTRATLNDKEFAANFANSRLTAKPIGRTRLRRDLQRKKLPSQVVEQSLNEAYEQQSEEELIERAIKKRLRLKGAPETREEAKKLFDYLMRRGFSYDLIVRKVREAGQSFDASEEIE